MCQPYKRVGCDWVGNLQASYAKSTFDANNKAGEGGKMGWQLEPLSENRRGRVAWSRLSENDDCLQLIRGGRGVGVGSRNQSWPTLEPPKQADC